MFVLTFTYKVVVPTKDRSVKPTNKLQSRQLEARKVCNYEFSLENLQLLSQSAIK